MTTFLLKIIALISMLVDHIGAYLILSGSDIVSYETSSLMRSFGRMALPIFAFLLVIGYEKTSSLKKYIGRMYIFALISQIPFILAFDPNNYWFMLGNFKDFTFYYNLNKIIYIILFLVSYYYFICDRNWDKSIIYLFVALAITPIYLKINGNVLLSSDNLNIFYEFGTALVLISLIERLKYFVYSDNKNYFEIVLCFLSIVAIYYYVGSIANYGYNAILLIIIIRMLKNQDLSQAIIISIWGYYMYGQSLISLLFVILASILIYFYNGKKGPAMKYAFYVFYPLHLLAIGLINLIK